MAPRHLANEHQLKLLQSAFRQNCYCDNIAALSQATGLTPKYITNYFAHQRQKVRRKALAAKALREARPESIASSSKDDLEAAMQLVKLQTG